MNILVVGCGRLGSRVADLLDRAGHDVSVIDMDEENFSRLSPDFNGVSVCGMPMDMDVLRNAGVESCDAVVVASPDDNLNITVSQIVQQFFGIENVIARISDPDREDVFQKLGLRTICPTKLAGSAMVTAVTSGSEERHITFDVSTARFSFTPAAKKFWDCRANMVPLPDDEALFGVLHPNGSMELVSEKHRVVLQEGDQLITAKIID